MLGLVLNRLFLCIDLLIGLLGMGAHRFSYFTASESLRLRMFKHLFVPFIRMMISSFRLGRALVRMVMRFRNFWIFDFLTLCVWLIERIPLFLTFNFLLYGDLFIFLFILLVIRFNDFGFMFRCSCNRFVLNSFLIRCWLFFRCLHRIDRLYKLLLFYSFCVFHFDRR